MYNDPNNHLENQGEILTHLSHTLDTLSNHTLFKQAQLELQFIWITKELDYKVKCIALTVLKITSTSHLQKSSSVFGHLIWKENTEKNYHLVLDSDIVPNQ